VASEADRPNATPPDGAGNALGYDARMPRLACWSCGRQIYTVSPLDSLFYEERRCPRCGAFLNAERRDVERRSQMRRQNPPDDPGPPKRERRDEERRQTRRRSTTT
jgi:DNA-directed RNA polymerase subunit RPC12/RpoP